VNVLLIRFPSLLSVLEGGRRDREQFERLQRSHGGQVSKGPFWCVF
jgi:hypothetical protein